MRVVVIATPNPNAITVLQDVTPRIVMSAPSEAAFDVTRAYLALPNVIHGRNLPRSAVHNDIAEPWSATPPVHIPYAVGQVPPPNEDHRVVKARVAQWVSLTLMPALHDTPSVNAVIVASQRVASLLHTHLTGSFDHYTLHYKDKGTIAEYAFDGYMFSFTQQLQ